MDSVNPEYWIARTINPELPNPVWIPPTVGPPALLTLYAGTFSYYFELPIIKILGFSTFSLRFAQGILGIILLTLVYKIICKATKKPIVGLITTLLLAIEPAFFFSYRTQFQVMLAGLIWLLASLILMYKKSSLRWSLPLLSAGLFYGFAVYTYFIYLFFLPGILTLLYLDQRKNIKKIFQWGFGFAIGLTPYLYGYISMFVAVGNITETLNLIKGWLQMLQPTTGMNESLVSKIENSITFTYQAISNIGNQSMLISESMTPRSTDLKLLILSILLFTLTPIFSSKFARNKLTHDRNYLAILWILISSYLLFAAIFGGRLGSHHFILIVPFVYIILGVCVGHLIDYFSTNRNSLVAVFLTATMIGSLSLFQGSFLFERLRETGGVGLSTNALSNLAIDARQDPSKSIYIFPDWGFFMPFAFQTQNLVEYSLDSSLYNIERLLLEGRVAKVAFWNPESLNTYKEVLNASQLDLNFKVVEYFRNDRVAAFYLLQISKQ
jgi:4-amino-4-deoxy-L-arabinose transferase-like glycosyltransferase